jgi:transcriptional regulator of nitric oxide reductase
LTPQKANAEQYHLLGIHCQKPQTQIRGINMSEFNATSPTSQDGFALTALTAINAPRALLVSLDHKGRLTHQAIHTGQSIINIETELQDHLSAQPVSTEWLLNLRDYIDCRLSARAEAQRTGGIAIAHKSGFDIAHINAFSPIPMQGAGHA